MPKRTRLWCFTNFHKMDLDYAALIGRRVKYIAYGEETCKPSAEFPEGRPHHQGFIYFREATSSTKNVAKLLQKCHVGPCDGTLSDNEYYCSKQTELKEFGERPKQGTRMDITDLMNAVKDGMIEVDIAESNPALWCQYGRRLERYRMLLEPDRDWKTEVWVYWGNSRTGKSRAAWDLVKREGVSVDSVSFHNGFAIGYTHAHTQIWDDFAGEIDFREFLKLTDRYKHTVNVKGLSQVTWNPRRIIITSNMRPGVWYREHLDCAEIRGRISKIVLFTGKFEPHDYSVNFKGK